MEALDPSNAGTLSASLASCDAVLVAAPPDAQGCPGLAALAPVWPKARSPWAGYLSTTGVYGDRNGRWVREDFELAPASPEARRRVMAEAAWQGFAAQQGSALAVFRLPGIYGPGRSALDRVRAGEARLWRKPGHVFSRIHVDDLARAIILAADVQARGVFNICDDEPGPAADVTAYAYGLLGVEPPEATLLDLKALSPMAQRFWAESKRVSNARAKARLGWRLRYPTYREGLQAVLLAEGVCV